MNQLLENIREGWEKLSARERQMLSIMAGVAGVLFVFVAVWTSSSAVASVEEERDAIRKVLADIARSSDILAKRDAERKAMSARFEMRPPPLAAFLENKAKEQGLEVRQVVEQPEKDVDGYRRQNVRLHFTGVSLRPIMRLLASIEGERMPLAVDRVLVEHYQAGDAYKVELGVLAFENKKKKKGQTADSEETDEVEP